MDTLYDRQNDPRAIVEADRAHVWHHLMQHKPFMTGAMDPRIIVEGKGVRVWDIKGKEHIDAVSGGIWTVNIGYGRERVADVKEVSAVCRDERIWIEATLSDGQRVQLD